MEDRNSMTSILREIIAAKPYVENFKSEIVNKDVVVCLGNTRSGKSTIVNYILGNSLKAVQNGKGISVEQRICTSDGPRIVHGSLSSTNLPTTWMAENNPNTLIVDCPGFEDNRGAPQDIANTLFFNQFKYARSVKFVLVVDINDIVNDNVQYFTALTSYMQTIFEDLNQLNDAISIIFTKDHKHYEIDEIVTLLRTKIINVSAMQVKKELIYHVIRHKSVLGIFRMPSQNGDINNNEIDCSVTQAISNSNPILINPLRIHFTLSAASQNVLLEIYHKCLIDMHFSVELERSVSQFENYFDIDKYVFASTEEELGFVKTRLQRILTTITTQRTIQITTLSQLEESLSVVTSQLSETFERNLNFMELIDDCLLLNANIKEIVKNKYDRSLQNLETKIVKLINKIDLEVDARTKETVQYILSQIGSDRNKLFILGASLIPVAKKALAAMGIPCMDLFTFEIITISGSGLALTALAGIAVAAGGYALHYYNTVQSRRNIRREQGRN